MLLCNCPAQQDLGNVVHTKECIYYLAYMAKGKWTRENPHIAADYAIGLMNYEAKKKVEAENLTAREFDGSLAKKRAPVNYRYDALERGFLHLMARIGGIADKKHAHLGGVFNYKNYRLDGEKGAINHIQNHITQYVTRTPYDNDESGDVAFHLAAIAYNAMMEWWYYTSWTGRPQGPVPPVGSPGEEDYWQAMKEWEAGIGAYQVSTGAVGFEQGKESNARRIHRDTGDRSTTRPPQEESPDIRYSPKANPLPGRDDRGGEI